MTKGTARDILRMAAALGVTEEELLLQVSESMYERSQRYPSYIGERLLAWANAVKHAAESTAYTIATMGSLEDRDRPA